MHPLVLFPKEVWEEIVNHYDAANKLQLIRAHPILEAVFQYKESEWKFCAALPIILGNFYPKTDVNVLTDMMSPWRNWRRSGDQELKTAVLNCRKVSKLCKESVDNFVEGYWKKFASPPSFTGRVSHINHSAAKISQFLGQVDSFPLEYKGFLSASVDLWFLTVENDWKRLEAPTDTEMMEFLSHPKVGKYLKGLSANADYGEDYPQRSVNFVRDMLLAAPNLQSLSIDLISYGNPWNPEAAAACEVTFPPLPNLEKLCFTESRIYRQRFTAPCIDFKQYFAQLTGLCLYFKLWKEEYNREEISFPKLISLELLHIPIWERKNEVSQLFLNLETPKLEYFEVSVSGRSEREVSRDVIEKSVRFLKGTARNYVTQVVGVNSEETEKKEWYLKEFSNTDGTTLTFAFFLDDKPRVEKKSIGETFWNLVAPLNRCNIV